ncbi:MAG: VPLPA-CTERM-specific exosortase XrtD [Marinagarivorans sp.]|nr:VPLPA-CTERM-specific exosortase XrtD [Marinagarivorans sp.]
MPFIRRKKAYWQAEFGVWFWLLPLLLLPFLYGGALLNLVQRWLQEVEYSHGLVIPVISAYIISERWRAIASSIGRGSFWGVALVLLAATLLLVGEISGLFAMVQVSFVLMLWGLSFAYLGARSAALLSAPILILLFAIPVPYFLEVLLTAKLQLMSSKLGALFISWLGMPVFLSGNIIDLGRHQLAVVEACSGLRFLYPLMSVGFIVAYFYRAHPLKRALIFLSTIPITLVMNSFRIALTAVLVERYGVAAADGTVHDAEGWAVFALCLVLLLLEIIALERLTSRRSLLDMLGLHSVESNPGVGRQWPSRPIYASLMLLLVVAGLLLGQQHRQQITPPATHLALFPHQLGAWQAVPRPLSSDVIEGLKFSDYVMLNFSHPNQLEPINFYVAYYANQRKGESPHSPRVCIPGGGWEIESFSRTTLHGRKLNRVVIVKEGQKQLVYYWFVERGQTVANEYVKKWLLFNDFIRTGRTDGALVRVAIPVVDGNNIEQSEQKIQAFIALIQPPLATFLPAENIL